MNLDQTTSAFLFKEMLKMRRREMSAKQRQKNKDPIGRTVLLFPYAYERSYRQYIYKIMNVYSKRAIPDIRQNLKRWLDEEKIDSADSRTDQFNSEFQTLIESLKEIQNSMFDPDGLGIVDENGNVYNNTTINDEILTIALGIAIFNDKQTQKVMTKILGQKFLPDESAWFNNLLKNWQTTNFDLIKSLSDEYIKKLNFIVSDGVMSGRTYDKVIEDLMSMNRNLTKSRARLLARDQIGKFNGVLTKKRQLQAGVNMYMWLTAADERVRPTHKRIGGKICQWEDDTVYKDFLDETELWKSRGAAGMYVGIPGSDVQCRCTSMPVMREIINEIDQELEM